MQTRLLTVVECVRVFAWSEALAIQVYYWRTAQHSIPAQHRHSTAQHSTAQHSTAQPHAQHSTATGHSTAQHSTAQHSTAQHSTAQHSTAQHSTAHTTTQHSNSTAQRRTAHSTGTGPGPKGRKGIAIKTEYDREHARHTHKKRRFECLH